MQKSETFPAGLAAAMLGGAILAVPIFGWWPLVGIAAAVVTAHCITSKLR